MYNYWSLNQCLYWGSKVKSKEYQSDIRTTLELVISLLPIEEGEFLDEAYPLLADDEK